MPDIAQQIAIDKAALDRNLQFLTELEKARSRYIIESYFPDEGRFRRELYPKHTRFFAAGGRHDPMPECPNGCDGSPHRERCLMAGNRCITPWTPLEMASSTRLFSELLSSPSFDVRSWDGGSRCSSRASGLFLKSIEPAFRIYLGNGEFFDCSCRHRVRVALDSFRSCWVEVGQLIRASSGLHLMRRASDSSANCDRATHLYDGLLRIESDNVQGSVPLPMRVPVRSPLDWRSDAVEPRSLYNRVYPKLSPFSILDDPIQISDLCARFSDPAFDISARWQTHRLQDVRRLADAYSLGLSDPPDAYPDSACFAASGSLTLSAPAFDAVYFPFSHLPLIGSQRIQYIIPLGCQPIVDLTVDTTQCYETAGVVHSNTGKTKAAAFEIACHATGRYPPWWTGLRIDHAPLIWEVNDTSYNTRDVNQLELLGPFDRVGTGMIPNRYIIGEPVRRSGIQRAFESVDVEHVTGGTSTIYFKAYEQGWEAFTGRAIDVIHCDEEPPQDVYAECCVRTMTTQGHILLTFTPLEGVTEVVKSFIDSYNTDEAKV